MQASALSYVNFTPKVLWQDRDECVMMLISQLRDSICSSVLHSPIRKIDKYRDQHLRIVTHPCVTIQKLSRKGFHLFKKTSRKWVPLERMKNVGWPDIMWSSTDKTSQRVLFSSTSMSCCSCAARESICISSRHVSKLFSLSKSSMWFASCKTLASSICVGYTFTTFEQ